MFGDEVEDLPDRRAVATEQVLDPLDAQAGPGGQAAFVVDQRLVADRTDQRDLVGHAPGTSRPSPLTARSTASFAITR